MKILKCSLFSIMLLCLFSCERSNNCCTIIDVDVNLTVQNQQGQNLLASPVLFTKSNIETYHVINGQTQLFNQPNLDADKGFLMIDGAKGKEIRVFPYFNKTEKFSRTLIKFGNTKIYTIDCEFNFSGPSVLLQKVWFNGVLKSPSFVIVK